MKENVIEKIRPTGCSSAQRSKKRNVGITVVKKFKFLANIANTSAIESNPWAQGRELKLSLEK